MGRQFAASLDENKTAWRCGHGGRAGTAGRSGESEAIVLAYERGLRIILDDQKAREVAQRLGVSVTGTVGLLLKVKRQGVISYVRPLLDAL